jgi:hypothetical protein
MSFTTADAGTVLGKLGAQITNTHHVVGIVKIGTTHRVRLFYSHGKGKDLPRFVEHKWRRELLLHQDEWVDLKRCPLSGEDAKKLTLSRLDV